MELIQPQQAGNLEDRLTSLEKKFTTHNHADGKTQPVWIGQTNQGAANIIIPTSSGVLGEGGRS